MSSAQRQSSHKPLTPNSNGMYKPPSGKKKVVKIILITFGSILLLLASVYLGYWYKSRSANQQIQKMQEEIDNLNQQKSDLEQSLSKTQTELNELSAKKTNTTTGGTPTADFVANIEDAVKSGNTSALEGYMSNPVKVILAGSGGVGDRTPAQAVSDMSYLNSATDPWNFALLSTTLHAYQNGAYKQYFPGTAVVGQSVNNYVVAFSFDSTGKKIATIFMSNDANLLK